MRVLFLAMLPLTIAACRTSSQRPAPQALGTVAGLVLDSATGASLVGAEVVVLGTASGMQVTPGGRYLLGGITPGRRSIRAARCGYRPAVRQVLVTPAGRTAADIALAPLPGGCTRGAAM